jgi:hypothetical protein
MGNKFDTMSFSSRRHVDRRMVEDRRLFLKQEYLDHKPERRVSMNDRRMHGDRRRLFPDIRNSFREKVL